MQLGSPECTLCVEPDETTLHVLRDCSHAIAKWPNLVNINVRDEFFAQDLHQWLFFNLSGDVGVKLLHLGPLYGQLLATSSGRGGIKRNLIPPLFDLIPLGDLL